MARGARCSKYGCVGGGLLRNVIRVRVRDSCMCLLLVLCWCWCWCCWCGASAGGGLVLLYCYADDALAVVLSWWPSAVRRLRRVAMVVLNVCGGPTQSNEENGGVGKSSQGVCVQVRQPGGSRPVVRRCAMTGPGGAAPNLTLSIDHRRILFAVARLSSYHTGTAWPCWCGGRRDTRPALMGSLSLARASSRRWHAFLNVCARPTCITRLLRPGGRQSAECVGCWGLVQAGYDGPKGKYVTYHHSIIV
jgi:hypothetical protein